MIDRSWRFPSSVLQQPLEPDCQRQPPVGAKYAASGRNISALLQRNLMWFAQISLIVSFSNAEWAFGIRVPVYLDNVFYQEKRRRQYYKNRSLLAPLRFLHVYRRLSTVNNARRLFDLEETLSAAFEYLLVADRIDL